MIKRKIVYKVVSNQKGKLKPAWLSRCAVYMKEFTRLSSYITYKKGQTIKAPHGKIYVFRTKWAAIEWATGFKIPNWEIWKCRGTQVEVAIIQDSNRSVLLFYLSNPHLNREEWQQFGNGEGLMCRTIHLLNRIDPKPY